MDKPIYRLDDMINYFDDKGISYDTSVEAIKEFLSKNNYFYKLISYRKNFIIDKKGKYVNLSFELLCYLSSLDMQLRYLLLKMSLDLEHRIKTVILSEITNNMSEDGYAIVDSFIASSNDPSKTKKQILGYAKYSKYTSSLYEKYKHSTPIWVAFETMSFGTLVDFVNFYIDRNPKTKYYYLKNNLFYIKNIRNTAAHSSSLLNDIVGQQDHFANTQLITEYVYNRVSKTSSKKKLNNLRLYDITVLYIIYDRLMPAGRTKSERKREIYLFLFRARKNSSYYIKHNQFHSIFSYFIKVVLSR